MKKKPKPKPREEGKTFRRSNIQWTKMNADPLSIIQSTIKRKKKSAENDEKKKFFFTKKQKPFLSLSYKLIYLYLILFFFSRFCFCCTITFTNYKKEHKINLFQKFMNFNVILSFFFFQLNELDWIIIRIWNLFFFDSIFNW